MTANQHISVKDLIDEPGAKGIISDYQDVTDPKYIGPGTWNVIHRRAYKARSQKQQTDFIEFMKDICNGFPCFVCKGHCTEYIKNHPMEEYLAVMIDIKGQKIALGLFVWTWKFHNAVNTRINKPIMSWETAYNLYSEKESLVCSKNCLEAGGGATSKNTPHYAPDQIVSKTDVSKINIPVPKVGNQKFKMISVDRKR